MTAFQIPLALERARNFVKTIQFITVKSDWKRMYHSFRGFSFEVERPDSESKWIKKKTIWYLLADENYPSGDIYVFPAKKGGIEVTFPHQNYNGDGFGSEFGQYPFRMGKLCLDHPYMSFTKFSGHEEPLDEKNRIQWYVLRTIEWIDAALSETLTKEGEPFELPQPPELNEIGSQIVFNESVEDFNFWQGVTINQGRVNFRVHPNGTKTFLISNFEDFQSNELKNLEWGTYVHESKDTISGLWVLMNEPPIDPPWAFPHRWEDLYSKALSSELDINQILDEYSSEFREQGFLPFLIGFPIPNEFGNPAIQIHWISFWLPKLNKKTKKRAGFSRGLNETNLLQFDKAQIRNLKKPVPWLRTINVNDNQVLSRGALPSGLREKNSILIGCGAFGSMLSNLLIKAGFVFSHVFDSDRMNAGNSVRHTLGFDAFSKNKATELASFLNKQIPSLNVTGVNSKFPPSNNELLVLLSEKTELVIECTGDDSVLVAMKKFDWGKEKEFISLSFGFGAKRLYAFYCKDISFPLEEYRKLYAKWKQVEISETTDIEMPWEGIGCWHPVFPARSDDVSLWSAIATKFIQRSVLSSSTMHFSVWEMHDKGDMPTINLVENINA